MLLGALLCALAAVVILAVIADCLYRSKRELERRLSGFESTYRQLMGWDREHGAYNYVSIDGGKHWHVVASEGDGLIITGPADPQHVERILGMQRLCDRVTQHGPINLGDAQEAALLEGAGFALRRRKGY